MSDHETWEHPVACITAVASTDPDPVRAHRELYNMEKPPRLFNDRMVDPDLCRFYVLIHDASTGSDNQARLHLRKMTEAFGATCCRLLQINSGSGDTAVNDIWTRSQSRRDEYNKRLMGVDLSNAGKYLSLHDMSYIASLVDELVTNGIIPHLERKIKNINLTIASKKKGISGALSTWFRKKKDDVSPSGRYSYASSEIQLRKMADYCFLLRDYDSALTTYKLAASEFKNNKQDMKHYAGANEFIAISTLFVNQSLITGVTSQIRKEVDQAFELALSNYSLIGEPKFALRCALFAAVSAKARGDYKRATDIFSRAINIEKTNNLLNALLCEQTAYAHLFTQTPKSQIRKFALFIMLAGQKYYHVDMDTKALMQQQSNTEQNIEPSKYKVSHHAYRCYRIALQVHYSRDWSVIFEHMSGLMGDLSLEMTNNGSASTDAERIKFLRDSIQFLHDFVGGCNISGKSSSLQGPEQQKQNMKKFLSIIGTFMHQTSEQNKSPLDSPLQLPEINTKNFRILMNQYGNMPSYVNEYPRGEWRAMEESFIRSTRPYHVFAWDRNNSAYKESTAIFEPIFVEISVKNVLYIPIRVSKLCLIASFTPAKPIEEDSENKDKGYKVIPEEIVMKPGQIQTIRLSIIPTTEGELKIQGVSWSLENVIEGIKYFETKGRRLNETSAQRTKVMYEADNRSTMRVIGNMPLLDVELQNPPNELYQGQLHRSNMIIKNVGSMGLQKLKMKMSHPQFIAFNPNMDQGESADRDADYSVSAIADEKFQRDVSVVDLSPYIGDVLAPNEHVSIPLYFRGTHCGSFNIKFLFYYEPELVNDLMKFRLHKLQSCLQVNESLALHHFSQPSSVQLHDEEEFVLGITATNQRKFSIPPSQLMMNEIEDMKIQLHQVTAVSPGWSLTPLNFVPGQVTQNTVDLAPSESTTLYFKIGRINKSEIADKHNLDSDNQYLYHGNLFLQEDSRSKHAVSISSYPHLDMLYRECVPMANPIDLDSETPTIPSYKNNSYPFLKPQGLAIAVSWATNTGKIIGQSHILNTGFLPEKNIPIQMHPNSNNPSSRGPNSLCPIYVSLHYNDVVHHKFSSSNMDDTLEQPILTLPIVFQLSNISPDLVCDLTLELLSPDNPVQTTDNSLRLPTQSPNDGTATSVTPDSASFLWVGSTRLRCKNVRPAQQLRIPINACFFGPGKYNLNQFKLYWNAEEIKDEKETQDVILLPKKPTIMTFTGMQYLMSIEDK